MHLNTFASKMRALMFAAVFMVCSWSRLASAADTVIDIMLVYDNTATTWVNSNGGMTTFSTDVVNRMNQATKNSAIPLTFRLVHSMSVNYTTTSSSTVPLINDLYALQSGVAPFDTVLAARNTYGADVVAMLIDHGSAFGYLGQGFALNTWSGTPDYAYTVNAIRSVAISHSLTHEVGHNLGANHSKYQTSDPGPNADLDNQYSAGWYFTGSDGVKYHTIMSYNLDGYGNFYYPSPMFSTPLLNYMGTPAGNALNGDNARLIRQTMDTIANYRVGADTPTTYTLTTSTIGTGTGTVTSTPAGISCGSTCSASYASGTSVTLAALAASGSTFSGWGGSCSGSSSNCAVSMTAAKSVTASFATATTNRLISVTKSGTGTGTVTSSPSGISCGSVCATTFPPTTNVALTATAASGSTFAGWTGACSGTGGCTVAAGTTLSSIGAVFNLSSSAVTALQNGVAVTGLSGAVNSTTYFSLVVPAGATNLSIRTSGGIGDVDICGFIGGFPNNTTPCAFVSESGGNTETYSNSTPTAGAYYVRLDGYAAYSGVTLTASYTAQGGGSGTITGTSGNDRLTNGIGNNTVDGLGGLDTYVNTGAVFNFTLGISGDSLILTDNLGTQGTDTLRNIERLSFSNGMQARDVGKGQIGGMAYRIYKAAFNRTPDNGGLKFWMGRMDEGVTVTDVAAGFIASAEFTALYGINSTDGDFITRVYSNVLGRKPDQGGFDYWIDVLRKGASRPQVLVGFSESPENINAVAPSIANGIWLAD